MSTSEKFWDRLAKRYARSPIKDMQSYNRTMERTKAHLAKGDRVLEAGCGTGSTALLLAGNVAHITASDISGNMIEIARAKAKDPHAGNVNFLKATVFDETFDGRSFDVVLAFNFLHLLEDLPAALRRVNELLTRDGLFISKTLCMAGQGWYWRVLLAIMRSVRLAPHVSFLTIDELEEFVTNEGFEIIETGDYPASPPSRFIVARKRRR